MQIAWATILMQAFCNTSSDFHMEKTAYFSQVTSPSIPSNFHPTVYTTIIWKEYGFACKFFVVLIYENNSEKPTYHIRTSNIDTQTSLNELFIWPHSNSHLMEYQKKITFTLTPEYVCFFPYIIPT